MASKLKLNRVVIAAAGLAGSLFFAASAQAATVCKTGDLTSGAVACSGFYNKNVLNNKAENIQIQKNALAALGFVWDGNFNAVEKIESLNGSRNVDFSTLLQGVTYVAFHFGNGQGGPGNGTAFYKLDAGTGLDVINLFYKASSNAVLYSTTPTFQSAVPEPATWAMMIIGFGAVGSMVRTSRRRNAFSAA